MRRVDDYPCLIAFLVAKVQSSHKFPYDIVGLHPIQRPQFAKLAITLAEIVSDCIANHWTSILVSYVCSLMANHQVE